MYTTDTQNLIFDLGGVILDLDQAKTTSAFAKLAGISSQSVSELAAASPFFNDYEKGLIDDNQFRDELRNLLKKPVSDSEIDDAWNAMLGDLPPDRIELLKSLGKKHRVYLLSNTNNIHLRFFNRIVKSVSGEDNLEPFFEKTYYSHLLKMRKPDVEIFRHVLNDNGITAGTTLFLDDNTDNLRGAEKAGIKTIHITHPNLIFSIFA